MPLPNSMDAEAGSATAVVTRPEFDRLCDEHFWLRMRKQYLWHRLQKEPMSTTYMLRSHTAEHPSFSCCFCGCFGGNICDCGPLEQPLWFIVLYIFLTILTTTAGVVAVALTLGRIPAIITAICIVGFFLLVVPIMILLRSFHPLDRLLICCRKDHASGRHFPSTIEQSIKTTKRTGVSETPFLTHTL